MRTLIITIAFLMTLGFIQNITAHGSRFNDDSYNRYHHRGHGWMHNDRYDHHHMNFRRQMGNGMLRNYEDIDRLKSALNLSDRQVKKIVKINSQYRARYVEEKNSPDMLDSLYDGHTKEIEKLLTDNQKTLFRNNVYIEGHMAEGCLY